MLQSVRVARDAEGKVSLMATDLDAFATYTVKEAQSGPAVEVLVPLDQLTKTVKGMKAEGTITLIPDGKEKVKLWYSIAGNQVRQSVNALPPNEFPPVPKINQPSMPLEPGFGLALRQALECCSEDSTRAILKGPAWTCVKRSCTTSWPRTVAICSPPTRSASTSRSPWSSRTRSCWNGQTCWTRSQLPLAWSQGKKQASQRWKASKGSKPGWVKLESGRWTFITKEIYGEFPTGNRWSP